jgi:hypothetical protein
VNTGVGADAIFAGPASALKARLEADLMTAGRDRV